MSIKLPEAIKTALKTIENAGFEAWCVGGAVRDLLLGKAPYDFDITTNALPENIISLFPKTVPTGIKHGTVTVIIGGMNIEVTTYRTDGDYLDHRAPENVDFISSVEEDVKRRDFTMNSVLYNPSVGFYDPENGIGDIDSRLIRAVGIPDKRFKEDALRILRAFRFSAQLGFDIEAETKNSAVKLSYLLAEISVERVLAEIVKIFLAEYPQKAEPLFINGTFDFCGIDSSHIPDISPLPPSFAFRFAYFCNSNRLNAADILRKLKADNNTVKKAEQFAHILSSPIPKTKAEVKTLMYLYGKDTVKTYSEASSLYVNENPELAGQLREIIENDEPYTLSQLDINGQDLMELGFKGSDIGRTLELLLHKVIEAPELNKNNILQSIIK